MSSLKCKQTFLVSLLKELQKKTRKIAVYHLSISFLFPELHRLKEVWYHSKKVARNVVLKSIKFMTSFAGHVDGYEK